MKKNTFITLLAICFFTVQSFAQSEMLDKGFSIKFSFGFPESSYGFDGDIPELTGIDVNSTYGLEIGNQWYFLDESNFGLGLDVNWFDLQYGGSSTTDPLIGEIKRMTLEGSFLEFGPLVTFALNDFFAIDGYYNLRPTFMASYYQDEDGDGILLQDFSFAHGLGLGIRLKILYVGYEYTFGNFDGEISADEVYESVAEEYDRQKMTGINSKLIIGLQF